MQSEKFEELESRSIPSAQMDAIKSLEARARVHQEIESMKAEGKAFELSDEEERMLLSFRRFKVRMRKVSEIFTWQTRRPDGVQLAQDTAEIVHPAECPTEP